MRRSRRIAEMIERLSAPLHVKPMAAGARRRAGRCRSSNTTREEYLEHGASRRRNTSAPATSSSSCPRSGSSALHRRPIELYRALRFVNPSPYMFCLQFGGLLARRQLPGSPRPLHQRPHRHPPHRRHPPARQDGGGGRRPRRRTARRSKGARRAHHARRSRAQRRGPRQRVTAA